MAVIKAKDLPSHQAYLDLIRGERRGKKQAAILRDGWQQKKFSDLTGGEKDELLKAVALELGMIAPD